MYMFSTTVHEQSNYFSLWLLTTFLIFPDAVSMFTIYGILFLKRNLISYTIITDEKSEKMCSLETDASTPANR